MCEWFSTYASPVPPTLNGVYYYAHNRISKLWVFSPRLLTFFFIFLVLPVKAFGHVSHFFI
jgi:hypothetical protein